MQVRLEILEDLLCPTQHCLQGRRLHFEELENLKVQFCSVFKYKPVRLLSTIRPVFKCNSKAFSGL
jgi:hypothetical protein